MHSFMRAAALALALGSAACAPEQLSATVGDLLGGQTSSVPSNATSSPTTPARGNSVSGEVSGAEYKMFEIGPVSPGEEWDVTSVGLFSGTFVVALFNEDFELLDRSALAAGNTLKHQARALTRRTFLGVMPAYGSNGGQFSFEIARHGGGAVPAPRSQKVYLNFKGGHGVSVNGRAAISFGRFEGAELGNDYADATDELIAAIIENMRADYLPYNVEIFSSSEGPPPAGEYSTLYFGGYDPGLLGLADNVDLYNSDRTQVAVIYVRSFANFSTMELTPAEMGLMIANVGSHELGHLLGLYHTRDPRDLMDTTGSAWDLAANQSFTTAPLEPSVFPTGEENSREMLARSVGYAPGGQSALDNAPIEDKMSRRALLRRIATQEVRSRCGLCLNPDAWGE